MPTRSLDSTRLEVVRPDDLVVLTLRFRNVTLAEDNDGLHLERDGDKGLIIVELPPQAFAEQTVVDLAEGQQQEPPPPPGRLKMLLSGRSRLVFAALRSLGRIQFTVPGILDACSRAPVLTGHLAHPAPGRLFRQDPDPDRDSVLELPYGLLLSPGKSAGWAHTIFPAGADNGTSSFALWHTRLGVLRSTPRGPEVDERDPAPGTKQRGDEGRTVRAPWPPDGGFVDVGFATPLPASAREPLQTATSSPDQDPVAVDRLMLSSMGGWLDARWEKRPGTDAGAESWRHHATMGRDHEVRSVQLGWLYPYGHRTARALLTRRRVDPDGVAYLHREDRLYVRQPERTYAARGMPFQKVRILTAGTPKLADATSARSSVQGDSAFWPMVNATEDFLWDLETEDRAGRVVRFQAPLIFVTGNADLGKVRAAYEGADPPERRVRPMDGKRIVYVDGKAIAGAEASTAFDTESVELTTEAASAATEAEPRFTPVLRNAVATVPALREIAGKDRVGFAYHPDYLDAKGNPLGSFAVLTGTADNQLAFGSDVSGGMVAPDMAVTSLSATLGPLGGGPELDQGVFRPADFFGDTAKLFGFVPLAEIVKEVPQGVTPDKLPRLVKEGPGRTKLRWETSDLTDPPDESPAHVFKIGGGRLLLEVTREAQATGVVATTHCEVGPFTLALPLLDVAFEKFTFHAEAGRKVDVSVLLGGLELQGPLKFLNELKDLLPVDGFVDPPALEVTPEGVTAGYTLEVPDLSFGIFNLRNLAIGANAHLPLLGDGLTGVGFRIGERQNPFLVGVSYFAGMGFFGVAADLGGITMLEGSLEFGGALALDIGVASGAVTLTAGLYYARTADAADAFAGFVRVTGAMEVLGLIAISAQFYLELKFVPGSDPTTLRGTAVVVVKVEVLFFSKSVDMTVTKEFARSPAPDFEDLIPSERVWGTYCGAFADD